MKTVAKLIIRHDNEFLMMYRSDHPTFGADPDLPGGTGEEAESSLDTVLREVGEEIGLILQADDVREVYAGSDYSKNGTFYSLFVAELTARPVITMSWEHASFEWIDRIDFINRAAAAKDTYMHMAADTLGSQKNFSWSVSIGFGRSRVGAVDSFS